MSLISRSLLIVAAITLSVLAFAGCQSQESSGNSSAPDSTNAESVQSLTNDDQAPTQAGKNSQVIAAKDALFSRLSDRLQDVMKSAGPAAAIEVCSREAVDIAASVGQELGVSIGRTSLKLRNPKNAPPQWVLPLIARAKPEPQFVSLPSGSTGALLPIKLQARCLACHGQPDTIAEDVKAKLAELYPNDQATGFEEGDLRGWFWVVAPAENQADDNPIKAATTEATTAEMHSSDNHGPGPGRGMGMGMGRGVGRGAGMRPDMNTIHAMFASRDKIKRTVKSLPIGAEALTESDDEAIAALIKEHVPSMETRVFENSPLPPMTFHPIFVNLIKHADDYTLTYDETDKGVRVTYAATDPFVILLVQEHANLVSRFLKNGMEEIHKPYTLPGVSDNAPENGAIPE